MIIKSLLDNDMYKYTMAQCVLHYYPSVYVKYKFKCRNFEDTLGKNIKDIHEFVEKINHEIKELCNLKLTEDELSWLSDIRFFKPDFITYLDNFKLDESLVHCYVNNDSNEIEIFFRGPWIKTILFEVPILAIVSELYTQEMVGELSNLKKNFDSYFPQPIFKFTDMGTRRRASLDHHVSVVKHFVDTFSTFIGTSNLYIAKMLNIKPIGTMAHEWIQAHQQLSPILNSQEEALQVWADEYRGDLGIALSDTLGFDAFLNEFDMYFAKLFDGCRHDSGDPFEWTAKLISHYKSMNIDPKTKSAIYSDGLDFNKCYLIHKTFKDMINVSFGIGTWLTNNVGFTPPQNVIKMVSCNGGPVAKISDDPGKGMCENENYLNYINGLF